MKLVMFDLDGTLTESFQDDMIFFEQALREGLSTNNFSRDWASYQNVSEAGISRELANRMTPDSSERLVSRVKQIFLQRWGTELSKGTSRIRAVTGSSQLLNTLNDLPGIALALATGTWSEAASAKLAAAGLQLPPDMAIASCDDADSRVDIMKAAFERAAFCHHVDSFDPVTYVGDGIWDAIACRKLNWTFIARSDPENASALSEAGAVAVFPDFSDTAAFLNALGDPPF